MWFQPVIHVLLTQNVSIDDSLVSDVDTSAIDWHAEQNADPDIRRVKTLLQIRHKLTKRKTSFESEGVRKYLRDWDKFTLKDRILYRYSNLYCEKVSQLVLPPVYRDVLFQELHDDAGHQGRDRTLFLIKSRFNWPGMDKDIDIKVKSCSNCIIKKSKCKTAELVNMQSSYPFELVCIDYLSLEQSKCGFSLEQSKGRYENILVITDHFTRYAQAIPTRIQKAKTTAKCLWENFIQHYSFPARLHIDQGRNFLSKIIVELCKLANRKQIQDHSLSPSR